VVAKSDSNRTRSRAKNYILSYFILETLSRLGNPQCKTFIFKLPWKPHFLTLSHNPLHVFYVYWRWKLEFKPLFAFPHTPLSPPTPFSTSGTFSWADNPTIVKASGLLRKRKKNSLTNKRDSLNIKRLHSSYKCLKVFYTYLSYINAYYTLKTLLQQHNIKFACFKSKIKHIFYRLFIRIISMNECHIYSPDIPENTSTSQ
jgi:hypothetical protein